MLGVLEGDLAGLQRGVHPPALPLNLRDRGVGDVTSQVVACCLEHGQRLLEECGQPLRRALLRLDGGAEDARLDPRAELADMIARDGGTLGEGSARRSASSPLLPEQSVAELNLECEVEVGRRDERGGSLVEAHGRVVVLAEGRAAAAGRQAPPRRRGQLVVGG